MIPRYRAWIKSLKWMCDVTNISFDSKFVDICQQGDTERCTEMSVEFDEIKLMQSTGLKDKNGKEIFEGDVVSIDTDEFDLLFVKYESGIYWLMDDEECVEHLSDYYKYVSIVGNIYENPELLEVGK